MLTLGDVNSRIPTCAKCRGSFPVHLPSGFPDRLRLGELLRSNSIEFIRVLRELTGCDLADAKGVFQHSTKTPGKCHLCEQSFPIALLSDCPECRSLNIDLSSDATAGV